MPRPPALDQLAFWSAVFYVWVHHFKKLNGFYRLLLLYVIIYRKQTKLLDAQMASWWSLFLQGDKKLTNIVWKKMRGDGCMDRSLSAGSLTGILLLLFFFLAGLSLCAPVNMQLSFQSQGWWGAWCRETDPSFPALYTNTGRLSILGMGSGAPMTNLFPERAAASQIITCVLLTRLKVS